jgi:deoxyribonuclease V
MFPIYALWKAVEKEHENEEATTVAGVDVAYRGDRYFSVLAAFRDEKLFSVKTDEGLSRSPYVSSLFFLKEGPVISKLIYGEKMDLLFVNGHGICHPHHYGLATVIGLTHHIPTIGVARRLIKGKYEKIPSPDPDISHITQGGKITGLEIRAPGRKRSVFISPGFGISTEQTIAEYLQWSQKGKLPEPLRTAHIQTRRGMSSSK